MISQISKKNDCLDQKIINFLDNFFKAKYDIAKASEDASFRKYYRAFFKAKTYIIMVAPPDKEPINQFIFLAKSLKEKNINVPQLFEFNPNLGIVIMQDLGMTSLLDFFNDSNYQEDQMFDRLIQLIYQMQLNCSGFIINSYDHKKLKDELDLFHTWYLKDINFDQAKLLDIYSYLIERAGSQVQKFVHRDFHSRNLLINDNEVGVIVFQDALIGPVTYGGDHRAGAPRGARRVAAGRPAVALPPQRPRRGAARRTRALRLRGGHAGRDRPAHPPQRGGPRGALRRRGAPPLAPRLVGRRTRLPGGRRAPPAADAPGHGGRAPAAHAG